MILEFIFGRGKTRNLGRGWVIKNLNHCNEKFEFYPRYALAISSRKVIQSFLGGLCVCLGWVVLCLFFKVISSSFIENRLELEALARMEMGFVEKCFNNRSKRFRGHELDCKLYKCLGGVCLISLSIPST